jgi:hypothetical protein
VRFVLRRLESVQTQSDLHRREVERERSRLSSRFDLTEMVDRVSSLMCCSVRQGTTKEGSYVDCRWESRRKKIFPLASCFVRRQKREVPLRGKLVKRKNYFDGCALYNRQRRKPTSQRILRGGSWKTLSQVLRLSRLSSHSKLSSKLATEELLHATHSSFRYTECLFLTSTKETLKTTWPTLRY